MANILVLGISGNVSLGILRVLRKNFPDDKLIGSCIVNSSVSNFFCDEFYQSPLASCNNFISWFISICQNKKIDIVFSGVEEIIEQLAKNESTIKSNTKCILTFSNKKCLEIGGDKYKTVQWLKNHSFSHPKFVLPKNKEDIINFYNDLKKPIIIKPLKGKGSIGIVKVYELDDINFDYINYQDCIIQEMVGSESAEYTVGCYQNRDGVIVEPLIFKRELHNGHSIKIEIVKNSLISEYCKKITEKLNPFGPLNIQLRLDALNKPVCFELNVRFSGTTLIRDYFGFKDVVSCYQENLFNNYNPKLFEFSSEGFCFRAIDEFFFKDASHINLNNVSHYE